MLLFFVVVTVALVLIVFLLWYYRLKVITFWHIFWLSLMYYYTWIFVFFFCNTYLCTCLHVVSLICVFVYMVMLNWILSIALYLFYYTLLIIYIDAGSLVLIMYTHIKYMWTSVFKFFFSKHNDDTCNETFVNILNGLIHCC